jgi:hypothetical protein
MQGNKIIRTTWINFLGVFVGVLLCEMISGLLDQDLRYNLLQILLASLMSILVYGFMFWIGFIFFLLVLDLLLIVDNQSNLKTKLLLEWLLISSPFFYWAIIYQEYIFVVAVASFLVTQLIRMRIISKYIQEL